MKNVDEFEDQCWKCANANISAGYPGSYMEPPEDDEISDCKARSCNGGTMPDRIEWYEDYNVKPCPWFARIYPTEDERKQIRCTVCNSPIARPMKSLSMYRDKRDGYDEDRNELIKCCHCGHTKTVDYHWFWFCTLETGEYES